MLKKTSMAALGVVASSFLSLFVSCNRSPETTVRQRGELVVAMDDEMPGYFVLGGESYGYQYDLFKAYADYLGVRLRIVDGDRRGGRMAPEQDAADIVTTLATRVYDDRAGEAVPIYNSSYVLLGSRTKAAEARKAQNFDLIPFLKGNRLLVSSGLQGTPLYESLLDSLSGSNIYVSSRNSFDMMELIRSGKYDFLICEMSEAQLGSALVRGVEQVYTFDEPLAMSAVISSQEQQQLRDGKVIFLNDMVNRKGEEFSSFIKADLETGRLSYSRTPDGFEQREDFKAWLSHFRGSEEYAMLNDLYFERGIVGRVMGQGLTAKNAGGISSYDDLFRDMCEKEGYDWRLISAIAYSESRFNPYVVSRKGAKGLMQVMPRVARQFGVQGDLMDPENNVLLALKVLGKIEKSLDFAPGTSSADRMKIVLACYNAGLGHVLDARSLARKYGANPDSWSDVSTYLSLKSDPEVVKDDAVKCGRFNSSQTLAFVNKVFSKYTTYCNNISR